MESSKETQHQDEDNFDELENISENIQHENDLPFPSEVDKCNCCCGDKEKELKSRERLRELCKEYDRIKNILLERLLQLANLLVECESAKSSRYLYVPDEKPNWEMISRIAFDIFPELRQLEQTQRIVAEFLDSRFNDQYHSHI